MAVKPRPRISHGSEYGQRVTEIESLSLGVALGSVINRQLVTSPSRTIARAHDALTWPAPITPTVVMT